ncbi:MAG: hypothetical protein F6K23_12280 [Okeania sp. SIO2C9]|uniref:hypothetical protein n=1 Tax=Okeania sp. SIO2C9 TaxID=2607791 RepID=UPI0013BEC3B1|nr:hypothetical protein [Okeania sp. SIO2C9]NEQ73757.1 hypothetical protein [Okeania sp. SIO2C9]
MAKLDEEFNLRDWKWIAVHFPPSERETMAKVAWLICCKCTPEEIYRYNLDPRIVVPLCAVILLDVIDIIKLKKFVKEKKVGSHRKILELLETSEFSKLSELKQECVSVIKQGFLVVNLSQKWQSLFETLDIDLQFFLLYNLIKYRHPTRDDWCNIFLDVKFESLEVGFVLSDAFLILWMSFSMLLILLILSALNLVKLPIFLAGLLVLVNLVMIIAIVISSAYQKKIEYKATNPLKHIFKYDI